MAPLIFLLTSDALAPHQCDTDPVGWDSLKTLLQRDTKRHGVLLSVSVDLTFVKRAAAYLRLVYEGGADALGRPVEARGPEALVVLTVYEQDPNELRPVEIYRGQLDFTSYESEEAGVTARFKEVGFTTSLLTREDAEVDLLGGESLSGVALPTYAPVVASLHSQRTLQRFEMRQVAADTAPQPGLVVGTSADPDPENSLLFFFGMDSTPLNEFGLDAFAIGPEPGDAGDPVNIPFYSAKASGLHTFEVFLDTRPRLRQLSGAAFTALDVKYQFKTVVGGVTTITDLLYPGTPGFHQTAPFDHLGPFSSGPIDQSYHFVTAPATFTALMNPGDTASLYGEFYLHAWSGGGDYLSEVTVAMGAGSYLKMSAPTTTAPTSCAGLLVHEALQRLCEAATDQRDALYSDFYGRTDTRIPYAQDGPGAQRLITNGFLLRGFPLLSAPAPSGADPDTRKTITLALSSLYDSLDAIDCLGMGVEQRNGRSVVRVEPRAYFYQSSVALELGTVTGLKKSVYTDWLYNEVQLGYSHWQSGAPNGLDEFNGRRTYSLPLTQRKKTYTAISTLNAAGYLIEEARRDRYAVGATKEGQADAEPFVVCLRRDGSAYRSQTTEGFVPGSISGVIGPDTRYNLAIAPGRMLPRHGPWLRSGLFAQATKRLLLGKVEGNAHLVSQQTAEAAPLAEFRNVPVAELPPPMVLSETYEFTVRLRRGQMQALQANPYGQITFLDSLGTRKNGYLLRAERTPQGGLTTFTLLRAAS